MELLDHNNIGLAAFFKQDYIHDEFKILFEDYLSDYYKEMPNEIKERRNLMIYLTFLQLLASIFGMCYIIFRRSFVYVFINVTTLLLGLSGIYGCIYMHSIALLTHCLFTTSLTGAFFIYQIFDYFLIENTAFGNKSRINDNYILLLFSLPYLIDFVVGISNYFFISMISEYNTVKHKLLKNDIELLTKNISNDEINKHLKKNENICIICIERQRNTVIQPCGHVLACEDCIIRLMGKISIISTATCPICRQKISSYGKFILA